MDPYKVLGISTKQVQHQSDLDKLRHRAKTLFRRQCKSGKKFDAKKILEAYELIKKKLKGNLGEGQYKLLGRSRKERELDKHFNHQTKEIKKNKGLKRALARARHGTTERIHLPGDKERIPHERRRGRRRRRREKKQTEVNILEGLNRVAVFLPLESKFPKGIKLLHRWAKEYMSIDNREFVFRVLDGVCDSNFFMNNPDTSQDVIMVFEYVLGYFSEWFAAGTQNNLFSRSWHVATVLACRCFTDDAFVLSATLAKLSEALALLEQHRDQIGDTSMDKFEVEEGGAVKKAKADEDDEEKAKDEVKETKSEKSESESEEKSDGEDVLVKDDPYLIKEEADFGSSDDAEEAAPGNLKAKAAMDEEAAAEEAARAKREAAIKEESARYQAALERSSKKLAAAVLASPNPMASPSTDDVDQKAKNDLEILSSASSRVDVDSESEVCDVSEDSIDVKEEIDVGSSCSCSCSDEEEVSSEGSVEAMEGTIWPTPKPGLSLERLRTHFVERCLATLFQQRKPLWARPKIDAFFQDIFYRRSVFSEEQQVLVEAWQSRIKSNQRLGERTVGEANNPLEAQRPVVDSRETRTCFDADSNSWAAKQTFDSREASAQRVIR